MSCWHPKREKEITMGWLGKQRQETRKRQAKANMKIISATVKLSCMMINVKGCLGRQRRWGVELYRPG